MYKYIYIYVYLCKIMYYIDSKLSYSIVVVTKEHPMIPLVRPVGLCGDGLRLGGERRPGRCQDPVRSRAGH